MADFETDVELSISVPSRELRDTRRDIEAEFEDIALGVDAGIGAEPDGVGAVEAERERLRRKSVRLARSRTEDLERIVEILEDIEENTEDMGGDGDFFDRIKDFSVTAAIGGAGGAVGAAGAGLLSASALTGLTDALKRVPNRIPVDDPSPLGIEEPTPIPVAVPDPLPVAEPDPIPVEDPGEVLIEFVMEDLFGQQEPAPAPEPSARDERVMREDQQASERAGGSGDPTTPPVVDEALREDRQASRRLRPATDPEVTPPSPVDDEGVDIGDVATKGAAGGLVGALAAAGATGVAIPEPATSAVGAGLLGTAAVVAGVRELQSRRENRTSVETSQVPGSAPIRSSLQTASQTQPQVNVNVGDVSSEVQADLSNTVDEAVRQVEDERDKQIQRLRDDIDRQVRNLERDIQRGTSTGLR
jgi:hypothetical protein